MKKLNFVEMIMAQVAAGREVVGTIAFNKVDKKNYIIDSVDTKKNAIILKEQAPIDADEDFEPAEIKVDAKNAVVLHYVNNPNPKAAIVAKVDGKNLIIGDQKISMGTLPIKEVVTTGAGKIVLAATTDNTDQVNLYIYDVQADKFDDLDIQIQADYDIVDIDDATKAIITNKLGEIELKDDNGVPTGETVKVAVDCQVIPVFVGNRDLTVATYAALTFDAPIDAINVYDDVVGIVSSMKTNVNGYLEAADQSMIRVFKKNLSEKLNSYLVDDPNADVTIGGQYDAVTTVFDKKVILIRNNRGLVVVNDAAVVKKMKGFKHFIEVTGTKSDRDENVTTWTYANDDLKVQSFTQAVTDRGIIFTLV